MATIKITTNLTDDDINVSYKNNVLGYKTDIDNTKLSINQNIGTQRKVIDYFTDFQTIHPITYGTSALSANTLYCYPFFVTERVNVADVRFRVTVTGTVGKFILAGIYKSGDKGTYGDRYVPHELLVDLGQFSTTIGDKSNPFSSGTLYLEPNELYWFAVINNETTSATIRTCSSADSIVKYPAGLTNSPSGLCNHMNTALTYPIDGAMPLICPTMTNKVTTTANIGVLFFKLY